MTILDTDLHHVIIAFIIYSILGWFVESIYMSICNRKITNRGFAKGPFCPIYGFGATFGYFILSPLEDNYILIYLFGSILATTFEFIVGKLMIYFLGDLWWDYSNKPFNYKGIICLESSIAWGFYALGIVSFLNKAIYRFIDRFTFLFSLQLLFVIIMIVFIDYVIQLRTIFNKNKNYGDIINKMKEIINFK